MPHQELYIEGRWFPSVTTVIGAEPKPWLEAWREKWGRLAERKTALANAIGTEFHRCVESWLGTGTYAVQPPSVEFSDGKGYPARSCVPRVEGMMRSFVGWAEKVDGTITATELQVVSLCHVYSGTLDAVGTLGKKPMLYDWKTSSRIYPDMDVQLAAYAQAYREQTGIELKKGMIVHVSKDKPHFRLTAKTFTLGKRAFGKFLKLRGMFDEMQATNESEATNA